MELLKSNSHHMAGRLGQLDSLIMSKEQERRRIEKTIDGIMLSMADAGTSSRKLLNQKLDEAVDLKTAIENEVRSLREPKSNLKGSVIELNDAVMVIRSFLKDFDKRPVQEQKETLKDVLKSITVHPEKLVLEIYGKEAEEDIPFDTNEGLPAELAGGSSKLEHSRTAVRTAFRMVDMTPPQQNLTLSLGGNEKPTRRKRMCGEVAGKIPTGIKVSCNGQSDSHTRIIQGMLWVFLF